MPNRTEKYCIETTIALLFFILKQSHKMSIPPIHFSHKYFIHAYQANIFFLENCSHNPLTNWTARCVAVSGDCDSFNIVIICCKPSGCGSHVIFSVCIFFFILCEIGLCENWLKLKWVIGLFRSVRCFDFVYILVQNCSMKKIDWKQLQ